MTPPPTAQRKSNFPLHRLLHWPKQERQSEQQQQQQQQPQPTSQYHQHQRQEQNDEPIAKRLRVNTQPSSHQSQAPNSSASVNLVASANHYPNQQQQQQLYFPPTQQYYHDLQQFQPQQGQQQQQQQTIQSPTHLVPVLPYRVVTLDSSRFRTNQIFSFAYQPAPTPNQQSQSNSFAQVPTVSQLVQPLHHLQTAHGLSVNIVGGSYTHQLLEQQPQQSSQHLQQHQLTKNLHHNHQSAPAQLTSQKDMYFFKNNENSSDFSKKRARQFFNSYTSSSEPELIDPEGIEKLCADLQLKPDDPLVLVLSWKLKAKVMGVYTFAEWLEGMAELKCDTLPKLRNKLSYLQNCLDDPTQFKAIFRFSFEFAKENEQRYLDMTVARQMLAILLAPKWRLFPVFNEFLSTVRYRVLNKDQYYNVLDFSRLVDDDLLNYDEESAWPVILDEFVEYCRLVKGFPSPPAEASSIDDDTSGKSELYEEGLCESR